MKISNKIENMTIVFAGFLAFVIPTVLLIELLSRKSTENYGDISIMIIQAQSSHGANYFIISIMYLLVFGLFRKNTYAAILVFIFIFYDRLQMVLSLKGDLFKMESRMILLMAVFVVLLYFFTMMFVLRHNQKLDEDKKRRIYDRKRETTL